MKSPFVCGHLIISYLDPPFGERNYLPLNVASVAALMPTPRDLYFEFLLQSFLLSYSPLETVCESRPFKAMTFWRSLADFGGLGGVGGVLRTLEYF